MIHRTAAGLLLSLAAGLPAQAADYPAKPITMLVSFAPGGATDTVARAMAHEMSQHLKQNVLVVNRAGAGGAIGTTAIARAEPDGYTVGLISVASLTILPHMQQVDYDLQSFDYLCRAYDIPVFVLVTPDSPFQTMGQLIDHARANPGKINYATVGPGSIPNMAAMELSRAADIDMNHIAYKGEGPAVTDLLGKHVDVYLGTNAVATAHNLRRLAVASAERSPQSPETPTLTELGYPVVWSIMGGMIAPRGMEVAMRDKLQQACAAASGSPAYQALLERVKVLPLYADGGTFQKLLATESVANHKLLDSAGLAATPATATASAAR